MPLANSLGWGGVRSGYCRITSESIFLELPSYGSWSSENDSIGWLSSVRLTAPGGILQMACPLAARLRPQPHTFAQNRTRLPQWRRAAMVHCSRCAELYGDLSSRTMIEELKLEVKELPISLIYVILGVVLWTISLGLATASRMDFTDSYVFTGCPCPVALLVLSLVLFVVKTARRRKAHRPHLYGVLGAFTAYSGTWMLAYLLIVRS